MISKIQIATKSNVITPTKHRRVDQNRRVAASEEKDVHSFHGGIRFSPYLDQTEEKEHCLTGRGVTTNSIERGLRTNQLSLERSRHALNNSIHNMDAIKFPVQVASQRSLHLRKEMEDNTAISKISSLHRSERQISQDLLNLDITPGSISNI